MASLKRSPDTNRQLDESFEAQQENPTQAKLGRGTPPDTNRYARLQISTDFVCKEVRGLAFVMKINGRICRLPHTNGGCMKVENRTTVFYVDDNPKSSRLLTNVLEASGFRVITARDAADALSLCKRTSFDLALLDYEMPGMSGAELAQEIKFIVPDTPIVLISGYAVLPTTELLFVDAHFGLGTSLDDLLWTMRTLAGAELAAVVGGHRRVLQRADST